MYNGLTTADKGALLKAKECGGSTYSRWATIGDKWVRELTVNIDLALAQIAEMERQTTAWENCGKQIESLPDGFFDSYVEKHSIDIDCIRHEIESISSDENAEDNPLTWNERINQMTVEEKADYALTFDMCAAELRKPYGFCDDKYLYKTGMQHNGRFHDCRQCWIDKLNSPYAEGETK